jgi:hypothetical protein
MDELKLKLNRHYEDLKRKEKEIQFLKEAINNIKLEIQNQCSHTHVCKSRDYDGHRFHYLTICQTCDKQL